jgi:hypothetical protein
LPRNSFTTGQRAGRAAGERRLAGRVFPRSPVRASVSAWSTAHTSAWIG